MWDARGPQGQESRKIRHLSAHYTRGRGLDIGCGAWKICPGAIGVDSGRQWGAPIADITHDGTKLPMFGDDSMDYVFSSHFLEHVVDAKAALEEWWRVIKPGGCLVLYLPHADLYPRVGRAGANPDHKHDFVPRDIAAMMRSVAANSGCTILEDEVRSGGDGLEPFSEYSFFQVYQKRDDGQLVADPWTRKPRSLLIVRYGGYGDSLLSATILPQLKEKGYHITWNGTDKQYAILKHDPHIDAWLLQDKDQIPNQELGEYWDRLSERYDRVLNLSESIEGDLLRIPGRANYSRPRAVMERMCNINYSEYTATLADVPFQFHQKFYFKRDEIEPIDKSSPVIVWQLSGSAFHKVYPMINSCVIQLLYKTNARIICLGGEDDREIEALIRKTVARHYGETDRVEFRTGTQSIRQSIMIAMQADVVVGPETGVLNAVASEQMQKVIFLSHSSEENLTKYWTNTTALVPQVECYPCWQLHYGDPHQPGGWNGVCPIDKDTGGAACVSSFKPGYVVERIIEALAKARETDTQTSGELVAAE